MEKDFKLASQLLRLLDTENKWFTFAEVEKSLGVSDKTIRKIVEEINKQLPPTITIHVLRGKGIFLAGNSRNVTVREVIASMFRQTTFYKLMDVLFRKGGQLSIEEVADELFMSSSSLKRLITQLNNGELKLYHLRITYSSPNIKGNEMHIRYFFWKLFYEAHEFTGWPFSQFDQAVFNQLITDIEQEKGIVYFLNSKRSLCFLIAIILERVKQGEGVRISGENYTWEQEMFYEPVTKLAHTLERIYFISFSENEHFFMQSLFSLSQYNYYDDVKRYSKKQIELNGEKSRMVNDLLSVLLRAFPTLDTGERFMWEICEFFEKILIDNGIPEMMLISKNHLTTYVQNECQQLYRDVQACMQQWHTAYQNVLYNDYHLTKLTLLISSHIRYKSKTAFLMISEEFSIRHYVAKLIKKEIGDNLIINTSIMKELTDQIVQQQNIDFVISNFPIQLKSVPVVMISTIPTKRDLDNIRKELLL